MYGPDSREVWQKYAGELMHPDGEGKFIEYGVFVGIAHTAYKEVCEIIQKYKEGKNINKGG